VTVADACRAWVNGALAGVVRTRSGRRYREASVYTGEYRLRLHVLPYVGALPVTALTPGLVRRWIEDLEAAASATTARLALDALRPVLRRLVEHEVITANPCTGVRPPAQGEEARPIRFLTPAEGATIRAVAYADESPHIGAYVDLGLASGARRGELLALTWGPGGLDLDERVVNITASYSMRRREAGPTKSGEPRSVPIGAQVAARLREHRLRVGRPDGGERVFPFDPRPPWERVRKVLPAPLPTIHSLRHTAATWWLGSGLTMHAVADLLGHADPTLVLKRYGHALPAERAVAGERLEAFLEASAGA
jgi:integrase